MEMGIGSIWSWCSDNQILSPSATGALESDGQVEFVKLSILTTGNVRQMQVQVTEPALHLLSSKRRRVMHNGLQEVCMHA